MSMAPRVEHVEIGYDGNEVKQSVGVGVQHRAEACGPPYDTPVSPCAQRQCRVWPPLGLSA